MKPQEWFVWNKEENLYNYCYYCSVNEFNEVKFNLSLKSYSFTMNVDENLINIHCSYIIEVPRDIDKISLIKIKTMPKKFIYGFVKLALFKFKKQNSLQHLIGTPKNLLEWINRYKTETPFITRKQ